jgi:hypothetical protein
MLQGRVRQWLQATSPSSTESLDSAHKRRRVLHPSQPEHPENVSAAGAHHGSGTFDSTDSPTNQRQRNSLPVRGVGKRVRAQVEAFIRFAVSFVHERQDQRVLQSDLVTSYSAAHETALHEGKEEASARVNQFFRKCLVNMRSIKHDAANAAAFGQSPTRRMLNWEKYPVVQPRPRTTVQHCMMLHFFSFSAAGTV